MQDSKANPGLVKLFWIAAFGNVLLVLIPALNEWNHPGGEFSGMVVVGLVAIALFLAVTTAVVAIIRRTLAYKIGLALVCVPAVWLGLNEAKALVERLAAPSIEDQNAGRGYFSAPADRALADAIVAGDAPKVASLAPTAHLDAQGWSGMSFMQLALDNDHPGHEVLAALLRAGIDPDQSSGDLFLQIYNQKDEALLRTVVETGVDLNKHMGRGNWYLFVRYDWPEGLTLLLDHGANTEVQDAMGYTPIMRAAQAGAWQTIEILLAHGARTDHAGNDGRTLRDLLTSAIADNEKYHHGEVPPRIIALQASPR